MTANDYLVGMHWYDVVVIGAGHNGLTAALLLARKGLKVLVVEETDAIGGGMRTERPFEKAPELALSTGAPLVGLLPPDLLGKLGIELPTVSRSPHAFVPTPGAAHAFSPADAHAHGAMLEELSALRADLAPAWLAEPHGLEQTAERYVRPTLRSVFVAMCRGSARAYAERWGFASERALASVVACDAPADGGCEEPGSGAGLLLHHAATVDGAWRVVQGGTGTVTRMIADQAVRLGAILATEAKVSSIVIDQGVAKGVVLEDGTVHHATAILCSADPHRLRELVGREKLPGEHDAEPDARAAFGSLIRVHLALRALPRFTSAPAAFERGDFAPTIHLLPDDALAAASASRAAVKQGRLPEAPAIAMHVHTGIDPSLRGDGMHHGATLVANVPRELRGAPWEAEEEGFVKRLIASVDRFAPGTSDLVVEAVALTPPKIERRFGARGHAHPHDERVAFGERAPYATGIQALYSCSAAAHPTGAVVGGAGHGAAMRVLRDLGKPLSVPPAALGR